MILIVQQTTQYNLVVSFYLAMFLHPTTKQFLPSVLKINAKTLNYRTSLTKNDNKIW